MYVELELELSRGLQADQWKFSKWFCFCVAHSILVPDVQRSISHNSFHANNFSAQQTFTTSYFRRTILGLVATISSWLKIN